MTQTVKSHRILEGLLRINPKNHKDAYISAQGEEIDIYIIGVKDRNHALNGDLVAVQLNPPSQWKILRDTLEANLQKWKSIASEESRDTALLSVNNSCDTTVQTSINGAPGDILSLPADALAKYSFSKWCLQKTGKVVDILSRNHPRTCCGLISFDCKVANCLQFNPNDSRIPRILIPFAKCPSYVAENPSKYGETVFSAQITEWPEKSAMPFGIIIREIGVRGQIDTETRVLISENGVIDEPFPEEIIAQLEKTYTNWTVDEKERSYRRDFTNDCVFTIDPRSAKDLDDALSITPLPSEASNVSSAPQLYQVAVHIADVSFFIPENSSLDKEVQRRSTSCFLPHRAIHMLPSILSEKVCSLTPGEDKLTMSIVWTMDAAGKIYDTWFGRSIIRSCIKLTYDDASHIICNAQTPSSSYEFPSIHGNQWTLSDIHQKVDLLHRIACNLRQERLDKGAFEIRKTKYSFTLDDETGLPTAVRKQTSTAAHCLVREFMLLANVCVAKKIFAFNPKLSLVRRHSQPDRRLLRELDVFCCNNGIEMDSSTSHSLQQSLARIQETSVNVYRVVCQFVLRAMSAATYLSSGQMSNAAELHHFALNETVYTHFTSPIRRYCDVIVHRLLSTALEYQQFTCLTCEGVTEIADLCNKGKSASKLVSEASERFFILLFIKSKPITETAVVTGILDRAFDVIVLSLDLKCRIYLDHLKGATFRYHCRDGKKCFTITWSAQDARPETKEQIIYVTTQIQVYVTVPSTMPIKLQATLLSP